MLDLDFSVSVREVGNPSFAKGLSLQRDNRKPKPLTIQEAARDFVAAHIDIAIAVLKEEQNAKKFPNKDFTVLVDKKLNKDIADLKVGGEIQFIQAFAITQIALQLWREVESRSKIVTGVYFSNHMMSLNGKPIASSFNEIEPALKKIRPKPGDILRMINTAPYARRLELLGVTKTSQSIKQGNKRQGRNKNRNTKPIKVNKPNGAYFNASREIKKLFRGVGKIRYENISGADIQGLPSGHNRTFTNQPKKNQNGRPYLYPSIRIEIQAGGAVQ